MSLKFHFLFPPQLKFKGKTDRATYTPLIPNQFVSPSTGLLYKQYLLEIQELNYKMLSACFFVEMSKPF